MIDLVNEVKTLLTLRPSKYTIIALAVLGFILGLQLIAGVYGGERIDASHKLFLRAVARK